MTQDSAQHIFKHLKFTKNTPQRVVFSSLFSVFGNVVKHGLSVFHIFLQTMCAVKLL